MWTTLHVIYNCPFVGSFNHIPSKMIATQFNSILIAKFISTGYLYIVRQTTCGDQRIFIVNKKITSKEFPIIMQLMRCSHWKSAQFVQMATFSLTIMTTIAQYVTHVYLFFAFQTLLNLSLLTTKYFSRIFFSLNYN